MDSALRTILALTKSVSYLKIKNKKANEKNNSHLYTQSWKEQILFLENEKCESEEKIGVFLTKKLSFFENNKYTDSIRMVYEDILCMGLGTRNVDKVIKTALKNFQVLNVTDCQK